MKNTEATDDEKHFLRVGTTDLAATSAIVKMAYPIGVSDQNFTSSKALLRISLALCHETQIQKTSHRKRNSTNRRFEFQLCDSWSGQALDQMLSYMITPKPGIRGSCNHVLVPSPRMAKSLSKRGAC